jgi:very-short-patch-repair endonuclease
MVTRGIVLGQKIRQAKLQRARELRRSMTTAERLLWERLRANRLHGFHFRRQHIIHGFIVDFYCHAAAFVIEVDGDVHGDTREYDRERDTVLSARGLLFVRFTNTEVSSATQAVLNRITAACRRDLSPLPPSLRGKGEY